MRNLNNFVELQLWVDMSDKITPLSFWQSELYLGMSFVEFQAGT